MYTKIEETKKYLIEKFGEPKAEVRNGMKYRFENVELKNFDKLINLFQELTNSFKIELKKEHIDVICDFAKTEVQPNVVNVINKLERYAKEKESKINFGKKPLTNLLNCFEQYKNDKNYKPTYIMNYFVKHLKCTNIYHKENFKSML